MHKPLTLSANEKVVSSIIFFDLIIIISFHEEQILYRFTFKYID